MTRARRAFLAWLALALAGLAIAVGVTYAATRLVGEHIGLSAEPQMEGSRLVAPASSAQSGAARADAARAAEQEARLGAASLGAGAGASASQAGAGTTGTPAAGAPGAGSTGTGSAATGGTATGSSPSGSAQSPGGGATSSPGAPATTRTTTVAPPATTTQPSTGGGASDDGSEHNHGSDDEGSPRRRKRRRRLTGSGGDVRDFHSDARGDLRWTHAPPGVGSNRSLPSEGCSLMFSTIVIGFDASAQAHDALALTQALAGPGTEIVVCCVHPPEIPDVAMTEESLAVQAHERLKEARARLGDRPNTRYEERGAFSAGAGLHEEVERSNADLLVVGSSHRGAIGRVIPGSVTRQVLHAAPCAVAVAPAGLRDHPRELRRIGIAFNDQPESARALESAAQIAREHEATLTVLTVVDFTAVADGWASAWVYPSIRDDMHQAAEREGAKALAGLEGVDATLEVIDGLTAQELVLASSRLDLLVMGSRGYGPLRRALMGTVSGRVAEAAACPVLITPRAASATGDPAGGEEAAEAAHPAAGA